MRGRAPVDSLRSRDRAFQRKAPKGGAETSSIRQISPARLTTYAVFWMSSTDVGRFSSSATTRKVPSFWTSRSAPVFGSAGLPSAPPPKIPCERPKSVRRPPLWSRPMTPGTGFVFLRTRLQMG